MVNTLIKNKRYIGKYVATKDFDRSMVLASGQTPEEAYKKALEKGSRNPVITFVPTKEMVQIYPEDQLSQASILPCQCFVK